MSRSYDPHDQVQTAERQTSRDLRNAQESADWRWLLDAPQGRRLMADLLIACGLMQSAFSENALAAAHSEGRRSVGVQVYASIMRLCDKRAVLALLAEMQPDVRDDSSTRASRNRRTGGD